MINFMIRKDKPWICFAKRIYGFLYIERMYFEDKGEKR